MKTEEILSLIDGLRARGVMYFKSGDLELTLTPVSAEAPKNDGLKEDDDFEELLYHSAGR